MYLILVLFDIVVRLYQIAHWSLNSCLMRLIYCLLKPNNTYLSLHVLVGNITYLFGLGLKFRVKYYFHFFLFLAFPPF